jgi:GDP-mannose 6-dehydrogenase
MKIAIFGMGYVGVVSAACLLRDGHEIVGVELSQTKVRDLAAGRTPIQEPGVAELLAQGHRAGRLRATADPREALPGADMVWICVGTPSSADGGIRLDAIEAAVRQVGECLRERRDRPLVVVRSTVLPRTTRDKLIPILESASGLRVGADLGVVFHPEFLREGAAVKDFDHPAKIVVGESIPGAGERLWALYGSRYDAARFSISLEEAELVKYCDNTFHAVKITFANEVGAIARAVGVDARRVADVFCADTKLNLGPAYLRPGFAFGGSCLPKDLRALLREAALRSVRVPMLDSVSESNTHQIDALVARVLSEGPDVVGLVGLAFKPNTDDMRESPHVVVAKRLLGEGVKVKIFDPGVHPDRLIGSNKEAVQAALRHLETLLVRSLDDLDECDTIVINHPIVDASRVGSWLDRRIRVFDLVGVAALGAASDGYEGIAW